MEPIGLEAEELALLPPHTVVTFAKDQPEYRPLPAARLHGLDGRVVSRWTFTAEERAAIGRGEDLYLQQLTFGGKLGKLQPILLTVGVPEFCPADGVTAKA
jgi:hypothetical protein